MPKGPVEAAGLVHTVLPVDGSPRLVRDVLIDILVINQWFMRREAEDKADIWLSRFHSKSEFIIEESRSDGGGVHSHSIHLVVIICRGNVFVSHLMLRPLSKQS